MRIVFIHIIFLVYCYPACSLINQQNYIDIGINNVSNGAYSRLASLSSYEIKNYMAQTGFLFSFNNQNNKKFTGWFINASGNFIIKQIPIEAEVFCRINPFSDMMYDINWGIILAYGSDHFKLKMGNNFRMYIFNNSTIKEYDLQKGPDTRIFEPRNLMYSFSYYVKPVGHTWNTTASITNYDHFLIQQETNPMVMCSFLYNISTRLKIYSELWYQSAGLFNMQVNYFGLFFRTGLAWKIKG